MNYHAKAVFACTLVMALAILSLPAWALPDRLPEPGSIGYAIAQQDGTEVYLEAVTVEKMKCRQDPAYFVVRDIDRQASRIIIYAPPPEVLRMHQTIDVSGTIGTLANGERAVINPHVLGYYNESGVMFYYPPFMRLSGTNPWPWKSELALSTQPIATEPSDPGGPTSAPPMGAAIPGSIDELLSGNASGVNNGKAVLLECKNILGTGVDPEYGPFFIMGDEDGTLTLRVYSSLLPGERSVFAASDETDRVNKVVGQIRTDGTTTVLAVDGGPDYDPQGAVGTVEAVQSGSISYARTLADPTIASIPNLAVTENDTDECAIYAQELDRKAGLRVFYVGYEAVRPGALINVTGSLNTTADGEREIVVGSGGIQVLEPSGKVPAPLGMTNRDLGGSAPNELTPGVDVPPAMGPYNKGLFVKIWGRVTSVDASAKTFYVDDGCALDNGPGNPVGVKVIWSADGDVAFVPSVGEFLEGVVGISSSEARPDDKYARLLRVRRIGRPVAAAEALSRRVDLTWATQDHTTYCVYKGANETGPFSLLASASAGAYRDTDVVNGTTYYYKVSPATSGLEGPASDVVPATPMGGSPTVTATYDAGTSTYTYTVTCPPNNEFPVGYFEVDTMELTSRTPAWSAQGATVDGINTNWPFAYAQWGSDTAYASAAWDLLSNPPVEDNTAWQAQFTIVAPDTEPVDGLASTKGVEAESAKSYPVVVPGALPPTPATVGDAQTICAGGTSSGLGGNTPIVGTGQWSIVSGGTGSFDPDDTTPDATFTHETGDGPVVLRWTISHEPRDPSTADLTITVIQPPSADLAVAVAQNPICFGESTEVTVADSESGVSYQLRKDADDSNVGSPVMGDGGTVSLPTGFLLSDTTFNVLAAKSPCASVELNQKATVSVIQPPSAELAVGAAQNPILSGDSTDVTVEGSEIGVTYQLRNDADNSNVGVPVMGTGGVINLPTGSLTSSTTFNVLAEKLPCFSIQLTHTVQIDVAHVSSTTIIPDGTLGQDGWYTSMVTVTIEGSDLDGDLNNTYYKLDDPDGDWVLYEGPFDVSDDGEHTVLAYSDDLAGNSEDPDNPIMSEFKIDATLPTGSGQPNTQPNSNGWYSSDVTVEYTLVDATSGLATPQVADPGASITLSRVVTGEGDDLSDSVSATDKAGNNATFDVGGIKIDRTAPTITVVSAPEGLCHVINYENAVIRFSVADSGSGIDGLPSAEVSIQPTDDWASPSASTYTATSIGGGVYEVTFPLQVPGSYVVNLSAKDLAGNVGQLSTPLSFGAGGFTVEWLPPISNMDIYVMQDGSTVPVKFRLIDPCNNNAYVNNYLYTVKVIDTENTVWMTIQVPQPDFAEGNYHANVQTKDDDNQSWPLGDYTVIIEGPGIWDTISGPYKSRYGLQLIEKGKSQGKGRR